MRTVLRTLAALLAIAAGTVAFQASPAAAGQVGMEIGTFAAERPSVTTDGLVVGEAAGDEGEIFSTAGPVNGGYERPPSA